MLLLVLILGNVISGLGKKEVTKAIPVKAIKVYSIGKAPTVALQAQIEKNGVVKIVAQAPGIVQTVHVQEGQQVGRGQTLVSLSSNYQGGDAAGLQAQLAGAQLKNVNDTYGLQKDILSRQRDIATASAENTEQLRQITDRSLGETRDLLDLNEAMLTSLNDQIAQKEQVDPNDPALPALRASQAQLQAGVNQLRGSVRSIEYQTNTSNPPTLMGNLQKEITLKQLDVQAKALELNKTVSKIQYNLALVQAGIMHPAAPFAGTVQRVNVHEGQSVNPGTVIAIIASTQGGSTAVLRAPREIAESISRVEPSELTIGSKRIALTPSYVSTVATDGQLYSIMYNIPDGVEVELTDGEYMPISVPVGYADTNSVVPFVPIDAVYESQSESSVYVVQKNKAISRKVTLGEIFGRYVQITEGLQNGDQIILNRNVIAGDKVVIEK